MSASEADAKAASLIIMIGGGVAVFERVKPVFEPLGKTTGLVSANGYDHTCTMAKHQVAPG